MTSPDSRGREDQPAGQEATVAWRVARSVMRRRAGWLTAVVIAAGVVTLPVAAALSWLLRPSGGPVVTVSYAIGLWLVLVAVGVSLVVLLEIRLARRVTLAVLGAGALLLVCAVPAGTFWAFAFDHNPRASACSDPSCALMGYFATGPLAGNAQDELAFDRTLCGDRRDELRAQAQQVARDIDTATQPRGMRLFRVGTSDDDAVTSGDRAMVRTGVTLTFTPVDRQDGQAPFYQVVGGRWTFHLVNDDGWRVCQIDAPVICGNVVNCDPPATPTPGPPPTATPSPDPLGHLRCGPLDPFRTSHNCPDASPTPEPTPS